MEPFSILKRKEEKDYGEYRTKRCILDIYDAMTPIFEAGASSPLTTHNLPLTTYHSHLDPPPGPPGDAEGNFISVEKWDENTWPKNIHNIEVKETVR